MPPPMETVSVDIEEGVPGGVFTDTLDVSAEVIAVDAENRALTLKNSEGEEFGMQVGPQAVNFDQIQVGDVILEAFDLSHLMRYLVAGVVAAFPVALALSWMFDITPDGLERT